MDVLGLLRKGVSALNQQKQGTAEIIPPSPEGGADVITIKNYFGQLFEEVSPQQRPLLQAIEVSFKFQAQLGLTHLKEIQRLKAEQRRLLNRIETLVRYKEKNEAEKAAKELRRQNRLKRVRRQSSQPFQKEYLPWVLRFIEKKKMTNLTKTRLRVAIVVLILTGLRISEVRNLRVGQIVTLLRKNYMAVNLSKRGRQNHKFFLNKEGRSLLRNHQGDVANLLFLTGLVQEWPTRLAARRDRWDVEPKDSYLFSAPTSKGQKPLSRFFFNRKINEILRAIPELEERGITLTSHSFRHGFITSLWKKTKDLELVRQVIGHGEIGTTSHYVQELSDEERRRKLENLTKF